MTRLHHALVLSVLALSCVSAPADTSVAGIYCSTAGIIELLRGPDSACRGYLRTDERIAALSPVDIREGVLVATATYDDGTRAELRAELAPGPVLVLDGIDYPRSAVERP